MSKLEEALAQQLDLMGRDARWPFPAPVRELHPMWCCEHAKSDHANVSHYAIEGDKQWLCGFCIGAHAWHEYHHERNWRVDFAWPAQRVIVEVEGIRFDAQGGRHQTGAGFARDLEKYSALELAGWHVIRVSQREITSGVALSLIEAALRKAVEA